MAKNDLVLLVAVLAILAVVGVAAFLLMQPSQSQLSAQQQAAYQAQLQQLQYQAQLAAQTQRICASLNLAYDAPSNSCRQRTASDYVGGVVDYASGTVSDLANALYGFGAYLRQPLDAAVSLAQGAVSAVQNVGRSAYCGFLGLFGGSC